jgi:hypothetical protein
MKILNVEINFSSKLQHQKIYMWLKLFPENIIRKKDSWLSSGAVVTLI